MSQSIVEILNTACANFTVKTALIDKKRFITYGDLKDEILQTANFFLRSGIKPKTKVLVLIPFSVELYRVSLALNYIGATAVFIEDWISMKNLKWCCRQSGAVVMVTNRKGKIISYFIKTLRLIPLKLVYNTFKRYNRLDSKPSIELDNEAIISFTTGSSGKPKMHVRNYCFLTHQYLTLSKVKNSGADDIELITLPMFVMLNLASGGTAVLAKYNFINPKKTNFKKIFDQIKACKVNTITASPSFILNLTRYIKEKPEAGNIRKIITGGSPVYPDNAKTILDCFCNAELTVIFGSTEAEPISIIKGVKLCNYINRQNNGLPVGTIHSDTNLKILPIKNGYDKSKHKPQIGEIIISGPNVLINTNHNQSNTSQINNVLWHHTGDTGFIDNNGELFLTGPLNGVLFHNDEVFYPFVFEMRCRSISGVNKATLLKKENKLCAVLEGGKIIDHNQVKSDVRKLGYPVDEIWITKNIPKDPRHNGKIDYKKLSSIQNHSNTKILQL